MLCDLQAMKPAHERDSENFDPNDEVLLRCFTIPALLDGLRTGQFDTGRGAKTDIILLWAVGMHLQAEADQLSAETFEALIGIYAAMSREHISEWWEHVSEEYREANRPTYEQRGRDLDSILSQWRDRRSSAAAG
jgi:hypothetical protein